MTRVMDAIALIARLMDPSLGRGSGLGFVINFGAVYILFGVSSIKRSLELEPGAEGLSETPLVSFFV